MTKHKHAGGGSKQAIQAAENGGHVCPVCGLGVELTDLGAVKVAWLEKFGHRDRRGQPCPGFIKRPQVCA